MDVRVGKEAVNIPECDFSQSSYKLMIDNKRYFRVSKIGEGPVHLVLGGLTAEEAESWNNLAMGVDENDWLIKLGVFADESAAKLFIDQSQVMVRPIKVLKANNVALRQLLNRDTGPKFSIFGFSFNKTELMSLGLYVMIILALAMYMLSFFNGE